MRIAEAIFFVLAILSHYLSSWFLPFSETSSLIFTLALGLTYFPLGIILMKDPASLRRWQFLSLFAGLGYALALLGGYLKYTFISESNNLLVISLFLCLIALAISGLFLFRTENNQKQSLPYYRGIFYRAVFFTLISLAFLGADRNSLAKLKYQAYPDYSKLLLEHLANPDNAAVEAKLKELKAEKSKR